MKDLKFRKIPQEYCAKKILDNNTPSYFKTFFRRHLQDQRLPTWEELRREMWVWSNNLSAQNALYDSDLKILDQFEEDLNNYDRENREHYISGVEWKSSIR